MSPKLPRWTAKQIIRFLKKHGFKEDGQSGSHLHLFNRQTNKRTTIPIHAGKIIGPGLLKSVLTQTGISSEELWK